MNNRPRAPLIQEIISRLSDYDRHEFLENRRKLIEKWHELHTEAIAQEYAGLHKLDLIEENPDKLSKDRTVKIYANDIYSVSLRGRGQGVPDTRGNHATRHLESRRHGASRLAGHAGNQRTSSWAKRWKASSCSRPNRGTSIRRITTASGVSRA